MPQLTITIIFMIEGITIEMKLTNQEQKILIPNGKNPCHIENTKPAVINFGSNQGH